MVKLHGSTCQNFVSFDSFCFKLFIKLLELITTTLKVAEMSKVVYEELPNYTKEELYADIGGALGLILGLNVLDVLVFSGALIKRLTLGWFICCQAGRQTFASLRDKVYVIYFDCSFLRTV